MCIPLILLGLFLSGCNQKVEKQAQTNNHTQVVQATVTSPTNIEIPELNNIKNTKYPDVVAEVGSSQITGLQLTREIAIKQNDYTNNLKKPQNESFYEKVALGLLVKNALIDSEVKKKGITVTVEEAISYLEQQKESMDSLAENDPAKLAFNKYIKASGFDNISDYMKSQDLIIATQAILGRGKLKNSILQSIPKGQSEVTKDWNDYIDELINQGNYKILIPVDIKGYQQLEKQVVLGK